MKDNKSKQAWAIAVVAIGILFFIWLSSLQTASKKEINCEEYTYTDYHNLNIPYKCKEAMEFFRTLPRP